MLKNTFFAVAVMAIVAIGGVGLSAEKAHAQVYTFCSDGSYFTAYGPSQWWNTVSSQGLCGNYNGFSPATLRWTWNITNYPAINYAKWDWHGTGYDLNYNGHYYAWIDSSVSSRTTAAPYTMTYNTASTRQKTLNQSSYSEQWTQLTTAGSLYKPRNVWLDDPTGETNSSRRVQFDEIKIEY